MDPMTKIYTVKAWFQIIVFLASLVLIGVIFYVPFITFYGFDSLPKVQAFPEQQKSTTPIVHMGLLIGSFNEFKIETGEFVFSGSIWFQYNPQQIPLKDIKKFHLVYGELKSVSDPVIRKVGEEEIAQFEITASFKNNLNYSSFPLDDHYITIGIFNYELPDGTILRADPIDFDLEPSLNIPGWRILSRELKIGFINRLFGKKDLLKTEELRAFFILKCKRTDPATFLTIILALMFILLVAVLPFSIEEYSGDLISGAIGGIVAFRFVLAAMSPVYVGYFMISDYLFMFALVAIVVAILGCILSRQLNYRESSQNWIVVSSYGIFLAGSLLSIFLA